LPSLAWPDILVGPGLFEGSTVFCFEQLMLDVEVFRSCSRLHQGIVTQAEDSLEAAIHQAGPGGNFLADRSMRDSLRNGELYVSEWGQRDSYEGWLEAGKPTLLEDIRWWIEELLAKHQLLPLDEAMERELVRLEQYARESNDG
jgi:trimethylamine:corrinoid methyltransferase-like protein